METITPYLWFDDQAEEAAEFYVSTFGRLTASADADTGIIDVVRYGEAGAEASGRPAGSVMIVMFRLAGLEMVALNGGPEFSFTEAISLMVHCESQQEVDAFWEALSAGGEQ